MEIGGTTYTIGADPEIFVASDNELVCAQGLVKGTKKEPFIVDKGAVQVDGIALELNTDPALTAEEFQLNLDTVRDQLSSMIGDHKFLEESSVEFDEMFLKSLPREATELGCEPDFNAYSMIPNPKPPEDMLMRTAGGHVHVGGFFTDNVLDYGHLTRSSTLAKALDHTLGLYSLFWDYDDRRRQMYGQAGCLRPKKYGMEYRTLSNRWIFKPQLVKFVYDAVAEAITNLETPGYELDPDIPYIINESDRKCSFFKGDKKVEQLNRLMGA